MHKEFLVVKIEGKRPFGRSGSRWECSVKMDHEEIVGNGKCVHWRHTGRIEVELHFFTSTLDGDDRWTSRSGRVIPEKCPPLILEPVWKVSEKRISLPPAGNGVFYWLLCLCSCQTIIAA